MVNGENLLGKEKVGKLLLRLAVPTIAAQLVNILYNIVDRIFIGQMVGAEALAGVGVAFPVILIISAFAVLVGGGGAPKVAIALGARDGKKASKILGNCIEALLVLSVILTVLLAVFNQDLLWVMGADGNTIGYASEYMFVYSLGTVFVMATLGLNPFVTAQGFAKTSMLTVIVGAVSNIILDPIFISVFKMGVSGAALATVISQAVSAVWVCLFLFGKKSGIKLNKEAFAFDFKLLASTLALGVSPFVMQFTEGVIFICFNVQLQKFGGSVAVGTMTILSSVMQFCFLPLTGLTQGAQPILSYNYGAKENARVKQTFKLVLISGVSYTALLWLAIMLFPDAFAAIFVNKDDVLAPDIMALCKNALRIYMGASILLGAQCSCQQTFVSLGKAGVSVFLAVLRKVILLIPLIFLLPELLSPALMDAQTAVFTAEPVADVLAVITTIIVFACSFNKILRKNEKSGSDKTATAEAAAN